MSLSTLKRGFTLIELLLVIGIIAILAAIVIVAINPTKQLGDARDAQRSSDVKTILDAVYQFSIDHDGNFPNAMSGGLFLTDVAYDICQTNETTDCDLAEKALNLDSLAPTYVVKMPIDPSNTSGTGTSYKLTMLSNLRIKVEAPLTEQDVNDISVTR